MGAYRLTKEWQEVEERDGVIQNTCEQNIEFIIVDEGVEPLKGGGKIIKPRGKDFFGLRESEKLYVRAFEVFAGIGFVPTVSVDSIVDYLNREQEPNPLEGTTNSLTIGLSIWSPRTSYYPEDWCVIAKNLLWKCTQAHDNDSDFDADVARGYWQNINTAIKSIEIDGTSIIVKNTLDEETEIPITALSAVEDADGNVITDTYATKTELSNEVNTLNGTISSAVNTLNNTIANVEDDLVRSVTKKNDTTITVTKGDDTTTNDIQLGTQTYATKTELSNEVETLNGTIASEVNTLNDTISNVEDGLVRSVTKKNDTTITVTKGDDTTTNDIQLGTQTYATKTELSDAVDGVEDDIDAVDDTYSFLIRKPSTPYTNGTKVFLFSLNVSMFLECTTAGTTDSGGLTITTPTVGATVTDGTVMWTIRKVADTTDATTTTHGLMSASDKTKLNGIEANANNYSLPTASASVKGGIKVGSGLSMNGDTLNNTYSYTLPTASASVKGGIKVGSGLSMNGDTLSATYSYTLPTASASVLGGIKVGSGLSISSGVLSVVNQSSTIVESSYDATTGSWYRKFSDGWVEQGGIFNIGGYSTQTITFLKPFKDTLYTMASIQGHTTAANANNIDSKATTNVVIKNIVSDATARGAWIACGMGASV